jgi:hypothetical protein
MIYFILRIELKIIIFNNRSKYHDMFLKVVLLPISLNVQFEFSYRYLRREMTNFTHALDISVNEMKRPTLFVEPIAHVSIQSFKH